MYENKMEKSLISIFLILALFHNILIFHWVMKFVDPYAVVLSGVSKQDYLNKKVNYFRVVNEAVNKLPDEAKIIFFGETRSYYCSIDNIVPTVFDKHPINEWSNSLDKHSELLKRFETEKITHIFINNYELKRLRYENMFSIKGKQIWESFKESYTKLLSEDQYCQLYEIKPL